MLPYLKKGLCRCNQVNNLKMKSLSGITKWVLSPITCIFIRKFVNMCPCKSKSEGDLTQKKRKRECDHRGRCGHVATTMECLQ